MAKVGKIVADGGRGVGAGLEPRTEGSKIVHVISKARQKWR